VSTPPSGYLAITHHRYATNINQPLTTPNNITGLARGQTFACGRKVFAPQRHKEHNVNPHHRPLQSGLIIEKRPSAITQSAPGQTASYIPEKQ
jgi:hypothetical protein